MPENNMTPIEKTKVNMLEPCQEDTITPDIKISLTGIETREAYCEKLRSTLCDLYEVAGRGYTPQKAQAQLLLQENGLGDQETWVVPANDRKSATNIITQLLKRGRRNIWISTIIANDQADPNAPSDRDHPREHAHLFRGFNRAGINSTDELNWQWEIGEPDPTQEDSIRNIQEYLDIHPELCLKLFPQDNKNLSVGRLIVAKDGITAQFQRQGHNARESDSGKGIITVMIKRCPGNPKKYVVFTDPEDIDYLYTLYNSRQKLNLLEEKARKSLSNLSILNPEFMVEGLSDPQNSQIEYFTDCIWGTTPNGKSLAYSPSRSILDGIPNMFILPPSMVFLLKWPNIDIDPVNTSRIVREALDGNPPNHTYDSFLEHQGLLLLAAGDIASAKRILALAQTAKQRSYFIHGSRPNFKDPIIIENELNSILEQSNYGGLFDLLQNNRNLPTLSSPQY